MKKEKSESEIELEQTIDFLRKRMSEYEFEYNKKLRDIKFLEEENKKLKDSNIILKKGWQVVFTLEKRIDELLEENKKLKEELSKLKEKYWDIDF